MPMKTCMKRMGALHYLVHLFTATLMTCMWSWIYLTFLAVPGKLTNYCELVGGILTTTLYRVHSKMISMTERFWIWFFYRTLHSLALEQREVSLLLKKLQLYYQPCNFCKILNRSKTCTHCNSLVVNIQPNQPYCSLKLTLSIGY